MIDDLYSAKVLALAANMPRSGRLAEPDASSEKVAKLCGSKITIDVVVQDGRVVDFGQDVKACALGQAAAAVLGANVIGSSLDEIDEARLALYAMLKTGGPAPEGRFSDLAMLAPVKDYPPRHASTMLAFEAATDAVRRAVAGRTSRADAVQVYVRRLGMIYERCVRGALRAYKLTLSPLIGRACRYLPTCSEYAAEALIVHGPWRGTYLAARRVCRCNPLGGSGYDPVPPRLKCET